MEEIVKNSKWVKLGEYVISVKGKKPKRVSKEKTKEYSIPYVNIKAFEKKIIDEYTDGVGCALCEDRDFLMVWDGSRSGYVGKAIKGALGSTLVKLNFPDIENNYAYYFLQSKFIEINTRAKGVGIPHVDPNILWNYDLLIPPKITQQAIVSKIEELFSEIENGIKSLLTAQQQLKTYRQSVLKWAFEGKLTNSLNYDSFDLPDENDLSMVAEPDTEYKIKKNQNNQNNQINHSSDKGELPEGWKWVKTIDVIKIINNGYTPTSQYLSQGSGEVPFIKVYNLNFNGTLNFEKNPTFIPEVIHKKDLKRSICLPGDVLINIVGPPLGKVSIVTNQYPEWNINQAIVMFRPNEDVISKYISYFMQNVVTTSWLENTSKATAGQWNVKVSTCREIPFPFCSIDEQQKVVEAIESRLSVADKLEESINQSLQQAEALKQSILKKAFEGRLIK
ncbi:MAG: restriction endonuclease subunit S [Bacteroidota bacterium]|nr:restriction endonuclease subunit S [Bacteroidota bacterium]